MKLLEGRKGLVFGVANQRSIAWGVSQAAADNGATLGFTYLNEALERRVRPLAASVGSDLILECDVQNDEQLDRVFSEVERVWGELDFVVHSVAYAPAEDLKGRFSHTSRAGFQTALDVSAYSFIAIAGRAAPLMKNGGSMITLSYLGASRVVPNYKLMGVAKAALESSVRELATDLGAAQIRVNALSAGPLETLAARGISNFKGLMTGFKARAPLQRNITQDDVAGAAVYFLSDLSKGVTGETHFVDAGFHTTV